MRKLLTDRGLKAVKPTGKQHTIYDTLNPHFGVRVSEKGKLAFVVMRRPAGSKRPVRVTLGHYPAMTLEAARTAASAALAELLAGKKPTEERRHRLAEQAEADASTFAGIAKRYKDHIADKRTVKQISQLIDRDLISRWDGRPIASISGKEVIGMVDSIQNAKSMRRGRKAGGKGAARQALIYCKRIFKFAVARQLLEHSPAENLDPEELIGAKKQRQRTLSDSEIKAIWDATEWNTRDGIEDNERGRWPLAPFIRLLLLLGVRRGELGKARLAELDLDKAEWLIPAAHAKTEQPHVVPLSMEAVRIFRSLPRFVGGDLVFTNDGERPLGSWTSLKKELDASSGVRDWVVHDLRRSARTNWSKLKVEQHVAELMLGHSRKGIEGTYDTYAFLDQRRDALEAWARHIHKIVTPPPPEDDKVVQLRA